MAMQDLPFMPDHWRRLEAAIAPDTLITVDRNDAAALARALATAEIAILAGDLDERHIASPTLNGSIATMPGSPNRLGPRSSKAT